SRTSSARGSTRTSRLEAREVEQLLDERAEPPGVLEERGPELDELLARHLVATPRQRLGRAVDDRRRRPEPVRRDRDEPSLQPVQAAELLRDEPLLEKGPRGRRRSSSAGRACERRS